MRIACFLLFLATPVAAAELHFSPIENLEDVDVGVLRQARETIDIAAYVLTDKPVITALTDAGGRGVKVRIYVDGGESGQGGMAPDTAFGALLTTPNVEVRNKRVGLPIMHLKAFCVDARWYRTGSANFTRSGLTKQDNDLMVFDDPALCAAFRAEFERIWSSLEAE